MSPTADEVEAYDDLISSDDIRAMDRCMRILAGRICRESTENRDLKALIIEFKDTRTTLAEKRQEAKSDIGKPASVTSIGKAASDFRDAI